MPASYGSNSPLNVNSFTFVSIVHDAKGLAFFTEYLKTFPSWQTITPKAYLRYPAEPKSLLIGGWSCIDIKLNGLYTLIFSNSLSVYSVS